MHIHIHIYIYTYIAASASTNDCGANAKTASAGQSGSRQSPTCVSVCVREKERKRERVCVCVCARARACVCREATAQVLVESRKNLLISTYIYIKKKSFSQYIHMYAVDILKNMKQGVLGPLVLRPCRRGFTPNERKKERNKQTRTSVP